MKFFYSFIFFILFIGTAFYYFNMNSNKSIQISSLSKASETAQKIVYKAKESNRNDEEFVLNISKDVEIFVLSDSNLNTKNNEVKSINVSIDRVDKNIILLLLSNQKVNWNIKATNNTNIDLVVYNNEFSQVSSKSKLYKKYDNIPYLEDLNKLNFLHFISYVKENLYQKKISYFYKQRSNESINISNKQLENNSNMEIIEHHKVQRDIEFELLSKDLKFIKFNLNGPINKNHITTEIKKKVTYNPSKTKIYEILNNGIKITNLQDNKEIIKKIPVMRKISNSKGIAYDILDNKVFVADKFGKFYVFDAIEENWISIRKYIEDFDINSLSYDLVSNAYLSSTWKNEGLILFDQKGDFVKRIDLENKLNGLSYYYDKKTQEVPQLYIVSQGSDIALILVKDFVEQIWLYDMTDDKTTLTYNYYDL